ncbi:valine--tRNA ligase [Pseudomarimonas arenosa]|uniref:Valine--tRNA ligase n=1 Tax=Pseudomarimonas arenosa TaxID=2774145 RepID=A0AAW3ZGB7_9GAMM|nr:valine--tRNA ligase [Pseudomarimonas arenosa]MBD8525061.1 valine--tRNA ligase [Pseudomarimonas arenosa]
MDKSFEPAAIEARWYPIWEENGCFKPSGKGPAYSIMLPPPNVTGTLHMGHAFQHTLMDALIRYHRMKGFDTLWQVGTDHAGIATEMVVNRNLALEGKGETRDSLGREAFVQKVWEWKQHSGNTITRQMRRLGTSGDWSRERFTMDEGLSDAVVETFVRLYEEGLIYRGQRLVNWDPVLKTAISDLEVVSEEENGHLWSIAYPLVDATLADGSGQLVVATTRPETMLGDVAVMVHPEDERYVQLIGKKVRLPLCDREIPIIADDYVDREFGTGVVKVTPAHDFNDYAVGQRHGLPLINIFTPTAHINDNAPAKYRGVDRYEARKLVLADLEAAGLLVEAKPHKLQVPRGDRTGQVIEPFLTDQWFVKMEGLAKRGLDLVESGQVKFVPENWISTYRHWLGNIQDWCISRQLWWGHRIPAWYDDAGNVYVARSEEEAYRRAGFNPPSSHAHDGDTAAGGDSVDRGEAGRGDGGSRPALRRDGDVLETWFSSALWSHSTLGWPNPEAMQQYGYDRYLPSSVLVTGFDIIFFWVARMIMMTDHFTGQVPFKHVYITGLVRDKDGQKMSKSKGNVLDPIDLIDGIALDDLVAKRTSGLMQPQMAQKIEKATRKEFPDGIPAFGADALRFTFASLASHGRDIKFDLQRCEGYKNFCNKLWNAARFVLMNCEKPGFEVRDSGLIEPVTDAEKWIINQLQQLIDEVETQFAAYRFDLAAQAMYEFVWNQYCDWFLELAKPALNGSDEAAADSTRRTLLFVLEQVLRILHPLLPFITEEIWQAVAPKLGITGTSISTQPYPEAREELRFASDGNNIEWLKSVVNELRRIRSELSVQPRIQIQLLFANGSRRDRELAQRFASQIASLVKVESQSWLAAGDKAPAASAAVVGELALYVPLAGLVDVEAEKARLSKEIKRIEGEIGKCHGKLGNDNFVANAPPAVVEQERERLKDFSAQLEGLQRSLAVL